MLSMLVYTLSTEFDNLDVATNLVHIAFANATNSKGCSATIKVFLEKRFPQGCFKSSVSLIFSIGHRITCVEICWVSSDNYTLRFYHKHCQQVGTVDVIAFFHGIGFAAC